MSGFYTGAAALLGGIAAGPLGQKQPDTFGERRKKQDEFLATEEGKKSTKIGIERELYREASMLKGRTAVLHEEILGGNNVKKRMESDQDFSVDYPAYVKSLSKAQAEHERNLQNDENYAGVFHVSSATRGHYDPGKYGNAVEKFKGTDGTWMHMRPNGNANKIVKASQRVGVDIARIKALMLSDTERTLSLDEINKRSSELALENASEDDQLLLGRFNLTASTAADKVVASTSRKDLFITPSSFAAQETRVLRLQQSYAISGLPSTLDAATQAEAVLDSLKSSKRNVYTNEQYATVLKRMYSGMFTTWGAITVEQQEKLMQSELKDPEQIERLYYLMAFTYPKKRREENTENPSENKPDINTRNM